MDNTKITIEFDLDQFDASDFDFGWWEDLQNGRFTPIRELLENYAVVDGLPPGMTLTNYLRSLKMPEVMELSNSLIAIINEKQNPVRNGKNSNGVSRNTSSKGPARRR